MELAFGGSSFSSYGVFLSICQKQTHKETEVHNQPEKRLALQQALAVALSHLKKYHYIL